MTTLIILGAFLAYWSMEQLMLACFKTKKNNYGSIVEDLLGKKAGLGLHITFILTTFFL